jgi:hypothetical protein
MSSAAAESATPFRRWIHALIRHASKPVFVIFFCDGLLIGFKPARDLDFVPLVVVSAQHAAPLLTA